MLTFEERVAVQDSLTKLGYDIGSSDGIIGPKTSAGIIAFKRTIGYRATDYVGPLTFKALTGKDLPERNSDEPRWLQNARTKIGRKEISGPLHNNWIAKGWARLGAGWFNSDETPWCGFFVADCVDAVGFDYPKRGLFARAKAWLDWGRECKPVVGAIIVFGRKGGGHVGFLVGESDKNYYVLGGNQRNAVNIMPLAKSRTLGYRWAIGADNPNIPLPKMSGGIVSTNEA